MSEPDDDLAVDPNLEDDLEEQPAKRPRLNESQDSSIEDETVLSGLSVNNNPTPGGEYTSEYVILNMQHLLCHLAFPALT
jgi:hypothetical protein